MWSVVGVLWELGLQGWQLHRHPMALVVIRNCCLNLHHWTAPGPTLWTHHLQADASLALGLVGGSSESREAMKAHYLMGLAMGQRGQHERSTHHLKKVRAVGRGAGRHEVARREVQGTRGQMSGLGCGKGRLEGA